MFSPSYSYRSTPRDKYLAAIAQAQAAEAEYLAAERLQQEEDMLRHRLEQIQSMKQPRYDDFARAPLYPRYNQQPAFDIEALRQQIAAEERQRILREQEEEAKVRKARALAVERQRALASEEAKLAALVKRSSRPTYVDLNDLIHGLSAPPFARPRASKPRVALRAPEVESESTPIGLEDVLATIFGVKKQPAPPKKEAAVGLEQLLHHLVNTQGAGNAAQVDVSQLFQQFIGGQQPQQQAESSQQQPQVPTVEPKKKEAAPCPAPAPTPAHGGLEQLFNQFAGGHCAPNHGQVDLSQLLNMFMGGQQPQQPQAESSKSAESQLKADLEARLSSEQSKEDQDLAEAIRMSLADLDAANSTTTDSKGKSPAPAPVNDASTSASEIKAIEGSFTALSNEWVFPDQLDFSTSRTSSPVRGGAESESVLSKLTYSAHNQPVRYYHQALSKLLARLDAVDSFGDEEVRHARKEVVGKVEGALDEVESIVESRWRKSVGRAQRQSVVEAQPKTPSPEPTETIQPYNVAAAVDETVVGTEHTKPNEEAGSDWSELEA
ncbi:BAG domain-containing protein [Mycena indigotica]|uniref:BAG domain-containing protein n=1 Tax=Mycena indigotica TaxID=2126181 RepID=A0A8H6W5G5_9AGAR|nr:BAG domain-containing protein [Mycena indigotica]KAF7306509.1 BAG domain-containing protein [Mycena indigotica]